MYRQSDRSAYSYIASYPYGHKVEFYNLRAKDVKVHVWFTNIIIVFHIDI
jgi:hypothetical protein